MNNKAFNAIATTYGWTVRTAGRTCTYTRVGGTQTAAIVWNAEGDAMTYVGFRGFRFNPAFTSVKKDVNATTLLRTAEEMETIAAGVLNVPA